MRLLATVFAFAFSLVGFASSAVYNGGDTVDAFLEATRASPLLNSLGDIRAELAQSKLKPLCHIAPLDYLSDTEKDFCHSFILAALEPMRKMNLGASPVVLKTQTAPLMVPGEDGVLRPVKAVTKLDSTSPVIFHYDSIKNMVPKDLLMLMVHEFGHKVPVLDGTFVTDNAPAGPFARGRRLLDSIGTAIAAYAVQKGRVGEVYGLADYFNCKVFLGDIKVPSTPVTLRYFPIKGNYDSFESGIGIFPNDVSQCYLLTENDEKIAVNLRIHEELGCAAGANANQRYTYMELNWIPRQGSTEPPRRLNSQLYPLWNPLCAEKPSDAPVELRYELNGKLLRFQVSYERSLGTIVPLSALHRAKP